MPDPQFQTCDILTLMHGMVAIRAARQGQDIILAFDQVRELTPAVAGIEWKTDHLSWCTLARALKPVLREEFPALAKLQYPDADYWDKTDKSYTEKLPALAAWVVAAEMQHGKTVAFSVEQSQRIKEKVIANMEQDPDAALPTLLLQGRYMPIRPE
jgi:hypothetical protein